MGRDPILRHIEHELWRRRNVVDSDPRIISNLIVDQTITNPAAVQAFVEGGFGVLVGGVLHFANEDGTPATSSRRA